MRIVLLSKRRMKIRLGLGYDKWGLSTEMYMRLAGKSSISGDISATKTYTYNARGIYHIPKHFIGKVIK